MEARSVRLRELKDLLEDEAADDHNAQKFVYDFTPSALLNSDRKREDLLAFLATRLVTPEAFKLKLPPNVPGSELLFDIMNDRSGFNKATNGGLRAPSVSEFVGSSGSGKTQTILRLIAGGLQRYPDMAVVYIDTTLSLSARRLCDIHKSEYGFCMPQESLSRIQIVYCTNVFDLIDVLDIIRSDIRKENSVYSNTGIIIIDSIAPLIMQFANNTVTRQAIVYTIGQGLRELSYLYNMLIITTNQLIRKKITRQNEQMQHAHAEEIRPALGEYWSLFLSHSFLFERKPLSGQHIFVSRMAGNMDVCFEHSKTTLMCEDNPVEDYPFTVVEINKNEPRN